MFSDSSGVRKMSVKYTVYVIMAVRGKSGGNTYLFVFLINYKLADINYILAEYFNLYYFGNCVRDHDQLLTLHIIFSHIEYYVSIEKSKNSYIHQMK